VVESITAPGAEGAPQLVHATNVYVLTDAGWRLAMHHASPPETSSAGEPEEAEPPHTLH
jgi:uncharacterized protein YndB with AHSA1/START domain